MFSLGDICWNVRKLKILHFEPPKIWQRPKFKILFRTIVSSWLVLHLRHVLWKSDGNSRRSTSSDFHKNGQIFAFGPLNFDRGQHLKFSSQQFVHNHFLYMCIIFIKDSIKTLGGVAIVSLFTIVNGDTTAYRCETFTKMISDNRHHSTVPHNL